MKMKRTVLSLIRGELSTLFNAVDWHGGKVSPHADICAERFVIGAIVYSFQLLRNNFVHPCKADVALRSTLTLSSSICLIPNDLFPENKWKKYREGLLPSH